MECLHPHCPLDSSPNTWEEAFQDPRFGIRSNDLEETIKSFEIIGSNFGVPHKFSIRNIALRNRILKLCPCLYTQIEIGANADAITHLCEVTLNESITSANVLKAFEIQHPNNPTRNFRFKPLLNNAGVGPITESFCSEVLSNEGVPHMEQDEDGWPIWKSPGHVSLNRGRLSAMKTYGDILIPAAPTNILISIKSEVARERLTVSGNRFESIGYGFFKEPHEFWAVSKINILKRMGFTAIYMPEMTVNQVLNRLSNNKQLNRAVNINGTPLYRPLESFGSDMLRVSGKISLEL